MLYCVVTYACFPRNVYDAITPDGLGLQAVDFALLCAGVRLAGVLGCFKSPQQVRQAGRG